MRQPFDFLPGRKIWNEDNQVKIDKLLTHIKKYSRLVSMAVEGDFFSLLEEDKPVYVWKFYMSPDLWDWVHWSSNSEFKATNGFLITCDEKCVPGFGNGRPNTLFFNRGVSGRIQVIGPKTETQNIADNEEQIKVLFAELVEAARKTEYTFNSPSIFPSGEKVWLPPPRNFVVACESEHKEVKKIWTLKMSHSFYEWAAKQKKSFLSQNGVKIMFDLSGNRTKGKSMYNVQRKMLLLDKKCKGKTGKLPKDCYQDINEISAALIELSEIYEMIGHTETQAQASSTSRTSDGEENADNLLSGDAMSLLQAIGSVISHTH